MAANLPSTRYADFVDAVRRHAPAALLPVLAAESAKRFNGGAYRAPANELIFPWVIAAAARESIAYGNAHRSTPVKDRDLGRMRNTYTNLHDPFFDAVGVEGALDSLLVRVAFEQFPYQHSRYEDMARILLLFDRDYDGLGCRVLSGDAWELALGMPLKQFMRAAFLILVGGHRNAGWFDPMWMSQPNLRPALRQMELSAADVVVLFDRIFGAQFSDVRDRARAG